MKPRILLFVLLFAARSLQAQVLPYTFSFTRAPYTALTNATVLNGTLPWYNQQFTVPLGFPFYLGGRSSDTMYLTLGKFSMLNFDTSQNTVTGIVFRGWFADRGGSGTQSQSPVRYLVSGTRPNRIFKLEVANAGFYPEYANENKMDYYANVQLWLYEAGNVFEIRFGPVSLPYPRDYNGGTILFGPAIGFNRQNGTGTLLALQGDTSAPTIIEDQYSFPLGSWPSPGTVYRFSPQGLAVSGPAAANETLRLFPNVSSSKIRVESSSNEMLSYQIITATGMIASRGTVSAVHPEVDISSLQSGTYWLSANLSGHPYGHPMRFVRR